MQYVTKIIFHFGIDILMNNYFLKAISFRKRKLKIVTNNTNKPTNSVIYLYRNYLYICQQDK